MAIACTSAFGLAPPGAETPVSLARVESATAWEVTMDQPTLRLLIHDKVAEGRLPPDRLPLMRIGPSAGESCDGCAEPVTKAQVAIEVLDATGGAVWFHDACFRMWDVERHGLGPAAQLRSGLTLASRPN